MLGIRRTRRNAAAVIGASTLIAGVIAFLLSISPPAGAASVGSLQQQIHARQGVISSLSGVVHAYSKRLDRVDGSISALDERIARIQADLNRKRAELIRTQSELAAARIRLRQLQARQAYAQSVLTRQLVNSYESGQPDLVTVVLESRGFQDLLERLSFASRIQKQDVRIIRDVRAARRAVTAQAIRLGALEVRQEALASQVLAERNSLAASQAALYRQRLAIARARGAKAGRLASVQAEVAGLQHQLGQALAAQAAASAQQNAAAPAPSVPSGQVVSGGGFTFPLPKGSASPPSTWSEDQGVDISAPGDTPEYAVCSGTIVLHGIGGFGPWAPVLHCDSSVGGYSYVYYGHAGPADQLPVGSHVGAGQVMSSIGPGIVGISTGPHLEIGFADSSGSPIGGSSASEMMSLLQGSY